MSASIEYTEIQYTQYEIPIVRFLLIDAIKYVTCCGYNVCICCTSATISLLTYNYKNAMHRI